MSFSLDSSEHLPLNVRCKLEGIDGRVSPLLPVDIPSPCLPVLTILFSPSPSFIPKRPPVCHGEDLCPHFGPLAYRRPSLARSPHAAKSQPEG